MAKISNLECRTFSSISDIEPAAWDACAGRHPFVQHAFFLALETSGALGLHRGVIPRYIVISNAAEGVMACAPAMLKWGNKREFGPEYKWLELAVLNKCFVWPKLQVDVAFFPVMGPKLLVRQDLPRVELESIILRRMKQLSQRPEGNGMFNIMHVEDEFAARCKTAGALISWEWHSMWNNPGYEDYEQYLLQLTSSKRYQLRKEQKIARSHGLDYKIIKGTNLTSHLIDKYYEGHRRVCAQYGGEPWLPLATYQTIAKEFSSEILLMGYFDGDQYVAGTLNLHAGDVLYALQWSEIRKFERVVFDLICHRPIEYAISMGIKRVDTGLDANHKRKREWETVAVANVHWIFNDRIKEIASKTIK